MRVLFEKHLPVKDNTKCKEYFNRLEQVICTNPNEVQREEFPPDDPAVHGTREYKYYSTYYSKKLASGHHNPPSEQDLGHRESKQTELPPAQDKHTEPSDMARLS